MSMVLCPECDGSGLVRDERALPHEMKAKRNLAGLTLDQIAPLVGYASSYLSVLETGKQAWPPGLEAKYRAACGG